ncbi:hypothetical protein L6164_000882 [Bauhinia variegata]|uniref:Uncharacterized protein n=1 Tax=Bauhinia variegata TaxID=167791 RepID=A0ACB9Q9Z5_BAUVA|nr:hypothetical protein L6164_000882 [Bauhinia variegata]
MTYQVNLSGGYYDAGDNLKLGFPMAFAITMLSWGTIEFRGKLQAKNELSNALEAIKWGTDYLIKAHPKVDVLYGEIGDPDSDHACWQRPEDMTTSRTAFRIDSQNPGSDLAAETVAALAAASLVFRPVDRYYSLLLLRHAMDLFDFARNHPGLYQSSIPSAGKTYSSSGYKDEMLWAAAWLHRATLGTGKQYADYLASTNDTGGTRTTFSWDDKYLRAQILAARLVLKGAVKGSGTWDHYKEQAEKFICSCMQKDESNNFQTTPGGLLWFLPWANVQYVTSATLAISVYSQYLANAKSSLECDTDTLKPSDLTAFVQSQVNYILGSNPKNMSYMVGHGSNYPQRIHHRAASIVSIKQDPSPVTCQGGYHTWFQKDAPNPNVLIGAVLSPDQNDDFADSRSDFQQAEPTTVTNAPLVGVLAYLA